MKLNKLPTRKELELSFRASLCKELFYKGISLESVAIILGYKEIAKATKADKEKATKEWNKFLSKQKKIEVSF